MTVRVVDGEISLIPYYPNEAAALPWYQDKTVCKQVDNLDQVYTLERLRAMYDYLSSHGMCYYIAYCGRLVGDVTLGDNGEVSIVVCREYQNRRIGRRCIRALIGLARERGMAQLRANGLCIPCSREIGANMTGKETDCHVGLRPPRNDTKRQNGDCKSCKTVV